MKLIIFVALVLNSVLAYHDPDLNYHLSQVQKISDCENGYSYNTPSVQLTTGSEKTVSAPAAGFFSQSIEAAPAYQYSGTAGYSTSESSGYSTNGNIEYSSGITYQPVPKITYATQPVADYRTSSIASNYAQGYATKEVHGYATSAGLSSSGKGSITPLPTYAQAPIIAKITAAPLIARFSLAPSKGSFVTQNLISQSSFGSSAKASLNSYGSTQGGGPVVSQVFAAPSAGYATHPALKVQQSAQVVAPAVQYNNVPVTTFTQSAPAVQYRTSVSHVSAPTTYFSPAASYRGSSVTRYSTPAVQYSAPSVQYSAPTVQYSAPTVRYPSSNVHYSAPAVQYSAPAVQYSTPAVQYSTPAVQYSAPAVAQYAAYSAPTVVQHTVPAIKRYSAETVPAVGQYANVPIAHISSPAVSSLTVPKKYSSLAVKNVHSEFLENYDAHPRYAFEYNVHDPHTGDIKHQKEERDGEVVKGQYSLVEPDGSVRTVDYVADWETGFHADVRNSKDNTH